MTSLEITFLGTSATVPTKYRNHPGIYVRYHGKAEHCFLMDCGEATQRQIFRFGLNFMRIEEVFITHFHADHFAGLLTLMETMTLEGRNHDLKIYGPEADRWVDMIFELGYGIKKFRMIPVNVPYDHEEKIFDGEEFSVYSFPVRHGIPAVGYRFQEHPRKKIDPDLLEKAGLPRKGRIIGELKESGHVEYRGRAYKIDDFLVESPGKSFSYTGDTKFFPELPEKLRADIIISESTYVDDTPERFHMSAHDCLKIYDKDRPELMALTHFSRRYADILSMENSIKDIFGDRNLLVARDGVFIKYGKTVETGKR